MPPAKIYPVPHTTEDEVQFIGSIGRFSEVSKGISRLDMLLRYRDSISRRTWPENIDLNRIRFKVEEEIRAETVKSPKGS